MRYRLVRYVSEATKWEPLFALLWLRRAENGHGDSNGDAAHPVWANADRSVGDRGERLICRTVDEAIAWVKERRGSLEWDGPLFRM